MLEEVLFSTVEICMNTANVGEERLRGLSVFLLNWFSFISLVKKLEVTFFFNQNISLTIVTNKVI